MKTFLALSALAALFQSVSCLNGGVYHIKSSIMNNVLADQSDQGPLGFFDSIDVPSQNWVFTPIEEGSNDFKIQSGLGQYINCGNVEDKVCYPGKAEEGPYRVELVGDNKYAIKRTDLGLSLDALGEILVISQYEGHKSQQFELIPVQWYTIPTIVLCKREKR
ncbi:hypothetical protein BDV41DRAFT_573072 [Aspergillus transmontanensis]|uniref:Ricin B lectin domain-containing protein n=1 Tax=Aspergillus transmontanensis TaxID=1034304 RepID=A0A5N6W9Q1_9EURO|nr:hypothetical protein BDV41DRAFT_573072 [Aspergillus transmontanensis]